MIKNRYLFNPAIGDLPDKMVFIGGPRQVGKTTLANYIGQHKYKEKYEYLNWDDRDDRDKILHGRYNPESALIIFDEIHKYSKWKNYIKGKYDKYKDKFSIIVTGSARLDLYRRGGDSLMGRYHYYRLHPFSLAEGLKLDPKIEILREPVFPITIKSTRSLYETLFEFGGFPEPFLKKDKRTLRRFHNERVDRLVREDIRDIEQVRDLSSMQVLVNILPDKVGSLLSINSIREDLNVSHRAVSLWIDVLERFYYHFRIYPYAASTIKSLRKEPKLFLWDWSEVNNEASRLENIVASHLLKLSHFLYDAEGYKTELRFLRDIEGREVDFLLTVDKKPWLAVEVKMSDTKPSKHLLYFMNKLKIPYAYQVVGQPEIDVMENNIRIISVDKFLSGLV